VGLRRKKRGDLSEAKKGLIDSDPALTKTEWTTVGDALMALEESIQDASL